MIYILVLYLVLAIAGIVAGYVINRSGYAEIDKVYGAAKERVASRGSELDEADMRELVSEARAVATRKIVLIWFLLVIVPAIVLNLLQDKNNHYSTCYLGSILLVEIIFFIKNNIDASRSKGSR